MPSPSDTVSPVAIALPIVALLLIAAAIVAVVLILRRRRQRNVRGTWHSGDGGAVFQQLSRSATAADSLPSDLRYYLDPVRGESAGWEKTGLLFHRPLSPGLPEYSAALAMLTGNLHAEAFVTSGAIAAIHAVFNPALSANFVAHRTLLVARMESDPELFARDDWRHRDRPELRRAIFDQYRACCTRLAWNRNNEGQRIPIVPALHATSSEACWKARLTPPSSRS